MTCPVCRRSVELSDAQFVFCSERCRLIDLGNWAGERYRIAPSLLASDQPAPDGERHSGGGEHVK